MELSYKMPVNSAECAIAESSIGAHWGSSVRFGSLPGSSHEKRQNRPSSTGGLNGNVRKRLPLNAIRLQKWRCKRKQTYLPRFKLAPIEASACIALGLAAAVVLVWMVQQLVRLEFVSNSILLSAGIFSASYASGQALYIMTNCLNIGPGSALPVKARRVIGTPSPKMPRQKLGKTSDQLRLSKKNLKVAVGNSSAAPLSLRKTLQSRETLIPERMHGVFMFCDIRNFTELAEVLQESTFAFVNAIAFVVHNCVAAHGGEPSKMVGDAILSSWRAPPAQTTPCAVGSAPGDAALACCQALLRILPTSVHLQPFLQKVEAAAGRPVGVRLGFGVHAGWAMEGVAGSALKMDWTLVSPSVNLAARLETATKQFAVDILASDALVALLSPEWKRRCVRIDRVRPCGSKTVMDVFTLLTEDTPACPSQVEAFTHGVDLYVDGSWAGARTMLEQALALLPATCVLRRPACLLLDFLHSHGNAAPLSWTGNRRLLAK